MPNFIKTAVIGHPISHSKSPLIHNYWLKKNALNGDYKAIDIHPDSLEKDVQQLIDDGYSGFNITIPHKITIMELCEEVDTLAQKIGAVNTVTIKEGKLYGTNTDTYGFIQNIKTNAPKFDLRKGKAVILGAGGAANAVLYALLEGGVPEVIITNRTRAKAEELIRFASDKIKIIDWDRRNEVCEDANFIINTTALGMVGKPELEIDISKANPNALITDIVYAPLITDLLKQAQSHGFKTVTGIGMLLHQARPGFELWNGIMPEVTPELEKLILS